MHKLLQTLRLRSAQRAKAQPSSKCAIAAPASSTAATGLTSWLIIGAVNSLETEYAIHHQSCQ
jgi:hypothetical protein